MTLSLAEHMCWHRQVVSEHLEELEDLEAELDLKLLPHAADRSLADTVLEARETVSNARLWANRGEWDYVESICLRAEQQLMALRHAGREREIRP